MDCRQFAGILEEEGSVQETALALVRTAQAWEQGREGVLVLEKQGPSPEEGATEQRQQWVRAAELDRQTAAEGVRTAQGRPKSILTA